MALGNSTQSVLSLIGTIQSLIDNFPMSILSVLKGKKYTSVIEFVLDVLMVCGVDTDEVTNYIISKLFNNESMQKATEWIEKAKKATSEESLLEVLNSWDPSLECTTLNAIEDTIKVAIGEALTALISCSIYPCIPNWVMDEHDGKPDYGYISIPTKTFDLFNKLKLAPNTSTGSCFYQVDTEPCLKRLKKASMVSSLYQKRIAAAMDSSDGTYDGVKYIYDIEPTGDSISDLPSYIAVKGRVDTGGTYFEESAVTYYKKTRSSVLSPNEMYKSTDLDAFLWYVLNRGQNLPQMEYNKMMWDSRLNVKKYYSGDNKIKRSTDDEWYYWLNSKTSRTGELYYSGSTVDGEAGGQIGYYKHSKLFPIMQLDKDNRANTDESILVYISSQKYFVNPKKITSDADDVKKYLKEKNGYWYIKGKNTKIAVTSSSSDAVVTIGPNNNIFIDGQDTNIAFSDVNGDDVANTFISVLTPNHSTYLFNWNYLQNIKLFSTKTMFASLIKELYSLGLFGEASKYGLSAIFTDKSNTEKIKKIISNIISVDDMSVEDCYYSFSNEDYNDMLEENELSKYNAVRLDDGRIVISDINNNDLIDTINNVEYSSTPAGHVTTTTRDVYAVANASDPENTSSTNSDADFLLKFINSLIYVFCEQLFTPKLVLLYCINLQITGIVDFNYLDVTDKNYVINFVTKKVTALVGPLILALKDIIKELLMDLFYRYVTPLLQQFVSLVLSEKVELWIAYLEEILNCIPTFDFNFKDYRAQISDVNYADIKADSEESTTPNNSTNCN